MDCSSALLAVVLLVLTTDDVSALNNGLARTPPMGWMTWERFRCTTDAPGQGNPSCADDPDNCISETLIKQHADILALPEWREAGYTYVDIDDCWEDWKRTSDGHLQANTTRFPSGMKALGDYVHSKGLQLGTYNDIGTQTCGGYPGECKDANCTLPGHIGVDAQTYAGWGIDSLKMDGCNSVATHAVMDPAYEFMGASLNATGRPILYSCSWPFYIPNPNWTSVAATCNMWRFSPDIQDSWQSLQGVIDFVGDYGGNLTHPSPWRAIAGPGGWNMPNVLIIGNFALSRTQAETQMALWSIMAAPLLMGNDLRNLDPEMKAILLAKEVIAVDQDPLGKQGARVVHFPCSADGDCGCCAHDVWVRELANGDLAVVLWFRGEDGTHGRVTAKWADLGIANASAKYTVRDLFKKQDLGVFDKEFSSYVDIDGVVMVRMAAMVEHKVYPPYRPTSNCNPTDWVHTVGSYDTSCSANVTYFSGLTPAAALARCCANPSCAGFSITEGEKSCSGYFKQDANCGNSTGVGYEGWTRRAALPTWSPRAGPK